MAALSSGPAPDPRRARLLEAAARLLAEEGPHALSLRRVAADAGGSTQLVYTLFGGKPGLADGLYAEGFRRLGAAMTHALAVGPGEPGDPERVVALGHAYRRFALAEPAFFSVMFGRSIPGFTPSPATQLSGRAETFGVLVEEVDHCLRLGRLVAGSTEELAALFWVNVHGLASLEVAGLLVADDRDAFADSALRAGLQPHRSDD